MELKRRNFLKLGASGIALAASGGLLASYGKSEKQVSYNGNSSYGGVLKISCQENRAPGEDLNEKLDYLEGLGVVGVEIQGREVENRVTEIQKALSNRSIKVSAVCAGFQGWLIAEDPAEREKCMASMKIKLEAAGALGSTGYIFVPAFNRQKALPHKESREVLIENLKVLGEFAQLHGTRTLLEPLNRREAHFCRQVADAASICRDVDHPGSAVMGDFWHMTWEETSDRAAFIAAGDYLHHVHIASRERRKMPGEDGEADNYVDGFKGLKEINYQDYISFECGTVGDIKETLPAAVKLISEQWEMA
jgi:sugar phosphate isomerase/epimerase